MSFLRKFCMSVFLFAGTILQADCGSFSLSDLDLSESNFYVSQHFGRTVGVDKPYTSAGVLLGPIFTPQTGGLALDMRIHRFNNTHRDSWAGNVGLIYRSQLECLGGIWGANFYYDARNRRWHDFNQVGAGLEYLSCLFDVRVNGYLPVGKKFGIYEDETFTYPGGYILQGQRRYAALPGVDWEIGKAFYSDCNFNIYGAVGGYYYQNNDICRDDFCGCRLRAALDWGRYLSFAGEATFDKRFHSRYAGIITLNIPLSIFSGCCEEPCVSLFNVPVYRQEMIVIDRGLFWHKNY